MFSSDYITTYSPPSHHPNVAHDDQPAHLPGEACEAAQAQDSAVAGSQYQADARGTLHRSRHLRNRNDVFSCVLGHERAAKFHAAEQSCKVPLKIVLPHRENTNTKTYRSDRDSAFHLRT